MEEPKGELTKIKLTQSFEERRKIITRLRKARKAYKAWKEYDGYYKIFQNPLQQQFEANALYEVNAQKALLKEIDMAILDQIKSIKSTN